MLFLQFISSAVLAPGLSPSKEYKGSRLHQNRSADWTLGPDGYLYCNKAIRPGETTAPLFTCVTFDAGMGNEYQDATATVHVAAEAVQTANNGVTALEALGWPTQG